MRAMRDAGDIELHIDRLVLHGVSRHQQHSIGEAIQQELLRQLTANGIPDLLSRQGNVLHLNAGSVQLGQGDRSGRIGRQVARAVYGSFSGRELSRQRARSTKPVQHETPVNHNMLSK